MISISYEQLIEALDIRIDITKKHMDNVAAIKISATEMIKSQCFRLIFDKIGERSKVGT